MLTEWIKNGVHIRHSDWSFILKIYVMPSWIFVAFEITTITSSHQPLKSYWPFFDDTLKMSHKVLTKCEVSISSPSSRSWIMLWCFNKCFICTKKNHPKDPKDAEAIKMKRFMLILRFQYMWIHWFFRSRLLSRSFYTHSPHGRHIHINYTHRASWTFVQHIEERYNTCSSLWLRPTKSLD